MGVANKGLLVQLEEHRSHWRARFEARMVQGHLELWIALPGCSMECGLGRERTTEGGGRQ